jgi:hypothetical protein
VVKGLRIILALIWLTTSMAGVAFAQGAAQRGRLLITVADPSGAIVADATVAIVGLDSATKAASIAPAKTDQKGVATFDGLLLGRYGVRAEFPGFELGLLQDVRLNRGDNKHVVVLPLKGFSESVSVQQDRQEAASSRPSLGSAMTREQLDALSDDPDEMRRQLDELAGPDATIRVDSFEGQQLPPKSQIKSIHITRDQYAAENHYIGGLFIDIITQPGVGPMRGNGNMLFNSSALNGRTEFTPEKGPEMNRNFGFGMGGTLVPRKLDISANVFGTDNYTTPSTYYNSGSGTRAETLDIRRPVQNMNVGTSLNWAVTPDQTIRIGANVGGGRQRNLGVGDFEQLDHAYSTDNRNYGLLFQEAGPLGRRFFTNTRMRVSGSKSSSQSAVESPTIVVNEAFTTGGAQRTGETKTTGLALQSDLDYVRGINSWRGGIQVEGSWYHSDDTSNYLGTYTFTNLENFEAGRPTFFTKRVGDPTIDYSNVQIGAYVQDDIRVSKSLVLSPGLRYEVQTHLTERNAWAPRFGFTWSPFKSGKTSIRGGGGMSYDWLSTGTYAQTLRLDGFHQLDLTITDPDYPDPGDVGTISATNRYLLGSDYVMPRNLGLVLGVDQTITPRVRVSASYTARRITRVARGRNLNAPLDGIRPDPSFLNVIETVSDAAARNQDLSINGSLSFVAPSPAVNQQKFNWKRMSVNGGYGYLHDRNNSDGPFSVPASGTLDTEWGPRIGSFTHRLNIGINSTQIKNVNYGVSVGAYNGTAYNITTGVDGNGDFFFNDRPEGTARNSARTPQWYSSWSARFAYNFMFGKARSSMPQGIMITGGGAGGAFTVGAAPPPTSRYRMSIAVLANNLTNRSNYSGYSGVLASPFYGRATNSGAPRRIQVQMSFGF